MLAPIARGLTPEWKTEYDFADEWKLPGVNPTSLQTLDERIATDPSVRSRWEQYYGVSIVKPQITEANFRTFYCGIDNGAAGPYSQCACPATRQSTTG